MCIQRFLTDVFSVDINKTAGSSIEVALGFPFQHLTAREMRDLVGPGRWEQGFSFTFVRNPWDKVASHYHFRMKTNSTGLGEDPIGFNEWVVRAYGERDPRYYDQPKMFMPQVDWIDAECDQSLVDVEGHFFRRLETGFTVFCIQIRGYVVFLHLKALSRGGEFCDNKAAEDLGGKFAVDIGRFGYEF